MDKLSELLAALKAIRTEWEGKVMPEDVQKDFSEKMEQAKALKAQAEEMKALDELVAFDEEGTGRKTAPVGAPETVPAQVKNDEKIFKSFGEQLKAIKNSSNPNGYIDPRLAKHQELVEKELKASGLNEAVGSEGGFVVQQDFVAEIEHSAQENSDLLNLVREYPVSGNGIKIPAIDETSRANGSRMGGVRAYWAAEANTVTASKPKFREIVLSLKKLMAIGYMTAEMLEDAPFLGAFMMDAFADEVRFAREDAIVNGDGKGKYLGVLSSPALVTVAKESGQAADSIVTKNIEKMWSRMWAPSRKTGVWIYNQGCEEQLMGLVRSTTVGSIPVFMPPGGLSAEPFSTILNRPAFATEYNAALGDKGDIAFVDFKQYITIAKQMRMASSMHVRFLYDEEAFKITLRTDGQPSWHSAKTPFKGTNTLSPYVTLAERA